MRLDFAVCAEAVTLGVLLESYERQRLEAGVLQWFFQDLGAEDKLSALPAGGERSAGEARTDSTRGAASASARVAMSQPKARRGSRAEDPGDRFDSSLTEEEVAAVSTILAPFRTEPERLRLIEAIG